MIIKKKVFGDMLQGLRACSYAPCGIGVGVDSNSEMKLFYS